MIPGYECVPGAADDAGRLLAGTLQPRFYEESFSRTRHSRFDGDRAAILRVRAARADVSQQIR